MEEVKQRLKDLGYTEVSDADEATLTYIMATVEKDIKNFCNILILPDEVSNVFVDMVCGEFLFIKKQSGQLLQFYNLDQAVKTVNTGDTTVTFADGTSNDKKLDILISYLINRRGDLICCRKIRW